MDSLGNEVLVSYGEDEPIQYSDFIPPSGLTAREMAMDDPILFSDFIPPPELDASVSTILDNTGSVYYTPPMADLPHWTTPDTYREVYEDFSDLLTPDQYDRLYKRLLERRAIRPYDSPWLSQAATPSADSTTSVTMLNSMMFPHILDMIMSFCDTPTLARMRLSRRLYRHITPMLSHEVPGCDGVDCGGLAGGHCLYWKSKEGNRTDHPQYWSFKDTARMRSDTVKIVQVFMPKVPQDLTSDMQQHSFGLPMGIESADTLVLPVYGRFFKSMHYFPPPLTVDRIVWYPINMHPCGQYESYCNRKLVVNYKHWVAHDPDPVVGDDDLKAMSRLLLKAHTWGHAITLVAPPDGVYEYIEEAIEEARIANEDDDDAYNLMYPELVTDPATLRRLTIDEYIHEVGPLVEAIESSAPPEGCGWRTFLVTPEFGEPAS